MKVRAVASVSSETQPSNRRLPGRIEKVTGEEKKPKKRNKKKKKENVITLKKQNKMLLVLMFLNLLLQVDFASLWAPAAYSRAFYFFYLFYSTQEV